MCQSARNVILIIFSYSVFKNSAPNSASAADVAKILSVVQRVKFAPLRWMGCLSFGFHPRNKFLSAKMSAYIADKYDAY